MSRETQRLHPAYVRLKRNTPATSTYSVQKVCTSIRHYAAPFPVPAIAARAGTEFSVSCMLLLHVCICMRQQPTNDMSCWNKGGPGWANRLCSGRGLTTCDVACTPTLYGLLPAFFFNCLECPFRSPLELTFASWLLRTTCRPVSPGSRHVIVRTLVRASIGPAQSLSNNPGKSDDTHMQSQGACALSSCQRVNGSGGHGKSVSCRQQRMPNARDGAFVASTLAYPTAIAYCCSADLLIVTGSLAVYAIPYGLFELSATCLGIGPCHAYQCCTRPVWEQSL